MAENYQVPKWFVDGKIGIFIHWGPYSVIGYRKGARGDAEHVPDNNLYAIKLAEPTAPFAIVTDRVQHVPK